jgi:hypothetical protein
MLTKKEQFGQGEVQAGRLGMSQQERLHYALRLVSKEWFSNTYYLDWFYKESVGSVLEKQRRDILVLLHQALIFYIKKSDVDFEPEGQADKLALLLYNDVYEISNRIEQVGEVQTIEIQPFKMETCAIDKSVDDYVDSLYGKTYDGDKVKLHAYVIAPRTLRRNFALVRSDTHQVKLVTGNEKFTQALLGKILEVLAGFPEPKEQPCFLFPGTQRFRIGHDPDQYPEFVLQTPVDCISYTTPDGQINKIDLS